MSWILGIVGAVLGAIFGAADEVALGLFGGAAVGAALGQAFTLRRGQRDLDARLARIEDALRKRADARAAGVGDAVAPPPAAAGVAAAAAASTPSSAPGISVAPETPTPAAPPSPAATGTARAATPPAVPPIPAATGTPGAVPPSVPPVAGAPVGAGHGEPAPVPPASARPATAIPARAPAPVFATASDEPRGPDVFERAIGVVKGWLFEGNVPVKIGLLVLFFGVAAALKYAADAGLLRVPIEFRLAGIAAGAIAGLLWGLKTARARPAFGLSVQGGAIGILLLTVFAAFKRYELIGATPAFVMVIILVAGASVLAVKQNAVALAVLGFIGGYLAPVLISTGSGNHVALFSYYAVLNAAVFGIAWKRPWRALNLVGFLFTFAIGGAWGGKYYRPELFATVEPFLVLFFLFYVSIPVLYALAGRERNGKVDGTLLFGTPLLAFPMQVGLLQPDRMALAASAVVVAAVYVGLALWARRDARLRLLAQSAAAMGVVFATLAVPLALSARWTSAAWALQGVGMIWLGLRQDRRITRWCGVALLFLAGTSWSVSLFHEVPTFADSDRFVLNPYALTLAILAFAHLAAAWLYDRAARAKPLAIILFLIGLAWWSLLGVREIEANLDVASDATAYGVWLALTAMLAAGLRRPLAWPRLSWPVAAASLLALLAGFASLERGDTTWFDTARVAWWPVVLALLLSARALLEPPSKLRWLAHLPVLALLSFGAGASLWRVADVQLGLGGGWLVPIGMAPLATLFLLAWLRPNLGGWPLATRFADYRVVWLLLASLALGAAWFGAQFHPGDSDPLPWLPVINPLELMLIAGLAAAAYALRRDEHANTPMWGAWAGGALLTLSMMVLRACHQLAGLSWSPGILSERLAQTGLTITWCVAGIVAIVLGSRRKERALWWAGAALEGVVLLKLIAIDRQYMGNLTGIASFVAVGLLLTFFGWIAPNPPRKETE